MIRIRIENNLTKVLSYLEILGYKWNTGHNPTEYLIKGIVGSLDIVDNHISYNSFTEGVSFEEFKRQNPIQKKHLRSGMVVEYANEERRLVVDVMGDLILISKDGYQPVEDYNEDLTIEDIPEMIIVAVGIATPSSLSNMLGSSITIWKKSKPKVEVTLGEIAEKFGISVEQLRIKEQ